MEQYDLVLSNKKKEIAKYFTELCAARPPVFLFIRFFGSMGSETVFTAPIKGRKLAFTDSRGGIMVHLDEKAEFLYETIRHIGSSVKRWYLAYERRDEQGRLHFGVRQKDPNDPNLPPIERSILRSGNTKHMIEVFFEGKICLIKDVMESSRSMWPKYTLDFKEKP